MEDGRRFADTVFHFRFCCTIGLQIGAQVGGGRDLFEFYSTWELDSVLCRLGLYGEVFALVCVQSHAIPLRMFDDSGQQRIRRLGRATHQEGIVSV